MRVQLPARKIIGFLKLVKTDVREAPSNIGLNFPHSSIKVSYEDKIGASDVQNCKKKIMFDVEVTVVK